MQYYITDYMVMMLHDDSAMTTMMMMNVSPHVLASVSNEPWRVVFSHHFLQIYVHIDRNKMVFHRYEFVHALLNDHFLKMNAYIFDIEMVFVPCECECVVLIHHYVRNVDHNHQRDMRRVVHELGFYLDDLDIFLVLLELALEVGHSVDRLVKESRDLLRYLDCIRQVEHRLLFDLTMVVVVVVVEVERSLNNQVMVPVSGLVPGGVAVVAAAAVGGDDGDDVADDGVTIIQDRRLLRERSTNRKMWNSVYRDIREVLWVLNRLVIIQQSRHHMDRCVELDAKKVDR